MVTTEEMEQYVNRNFDKSLNNLYSLVKIPTVTAKGGDHSYEAIEELERIFQEMNFEIKIFETKGEPVFTAFYDRGKSQTLLFYNHYDVQPAEPFDLWKSAPFEPEIRKGKIFGRGVADNKGNIIARTAAIKMLLDLQGDLPVNVRFVIEGEEETSSMNLPEFTKANEDFLRADGCIWEFGGKNVLGTQEIWGGVKGICYVQIKTTGPKKDLHSANGAIVENPANHLVAALASLRDDKTDRILIDDYYKDVASPNEDLIQAIQRISETFDEEKHKEHLGVDKYLLDLHGVELLQKSYFSPTCTICGIWSGWQGPGGKTVLPSIAQAKIDFRLVPNQKPDKVIDMLRKHFKKYQFNIEIEWFDGYPPASTPLTDPFVQVVKTTMNEVYGHDPLLHPWNPGSGPLYLFADYVPVLSIGVGNPGSNAHSPNENIEVIDFKSGQICIAHLMENMAK